MLKIKMGIGVVFAAGVVALGCADDDVHVTGRVVRITPATSYDGPVTLGSDSVARIVLYANAALGGDGESTSVAESILTPAPQLPFEFELTGPAPEESEDQYHLMVVIQQHAATFTVGDLTNESLIVVEPRTDDVVVEVQGMESCEAANAGGFCI